MNAILYLACCIPFVFLFLSIRCSRAHKRLLHSGKVPTILALAQKREVYLGLAILSAVMIIFIAMNYFSIWGKL